MNGKGLAAWPRGGVASIVSLAWSIAVLAGATTVLAAPVTLVGGFDHYNGAAGQTTNGVLGAAVLAGAGADLTAAVVRFDDSDAGQGYSFTGGLGLPVAPMMMLRATGTRFVGEQDLRAWRAKVGPQFSLPGERTVTLSYSHYANNLGASSNAGIAEATTPLVPRLSGRAGASYASVQGASVLQGSVGLGWTVAPHFELTGETGLVNGEGGAGSPGSPGGGLLGGLPIFGGGGGGSSNTARRTYGTLALGVRVTWP